MARKIPFVVALAMMAMTYVILSAAAPTVHELIHKQIFIYHGVSSEIFVNYTSMTGFTVPQGAFPNEQERLAAYSEHALNDIAYQFVLPFNIGVSALVFALSYFVLVDLERRNS